MFEVRVIFCGWFGKEVGGEGIIRTRGNAIFFGIIRGFLELEFRVGR